MKKEINWPAGQDRESQQAKKKSKPMGLEMAKSEDRDAVA